ncbi:hypothetical protein IM697_04215 [Streptomyces ferrugineus]|uniref:Metallothionein n=1 Tax=Streptomyces ferrugineus TaxID=1413221 RepID=A0A7M2SN09_9ACTN|nr:hypothetical protein [Streptomyces ferrugineus]QOV37642.1 hypothetical protein IM697_04215 [Streptomyces ferrugineus]
MKSQYECISPTDNPNDHDECPECGCCWCAWDVACDCADCECKGGRA